MFFHHTMRHAVILIILALGGGFGALLFATSLTPEFRVDTLVLITDRAQDRDPYTIIKFTERIAANLGEMVRGGEFHERVLARTEGLNPSFFSTNPYFRLKQWKRTVQTIGTPGTGFLTIRVYHQDSKQAMILASSILDELAKTSQEIYGSNVRIHVSDKPTLKPWAAKPSFFGFGLLGFAGGGMIGLLISSLIKRKKP